MKNVFQIFVFIFKKIVGFFKMIIDFNNKTKTTDENMSGVLKKLKGLSDVQSHFDSFFDLFDTMLSYILRIVVLVSFCGALYFFLMLLKVI